MEVATARSLLGLGPAPSWAEVRVAYRAQIAAAHPDRVGGDARRAALVTEAYAALEQAHRDGGLRAAPPPRPPAAATVRDDPDPHPLDEPPEVLEGDTVHVQAPPDEAFIRVLEACHRIGDVTYVDRSCAILETLVHVEGEGTCSLVITFQGRVDGTDAFCTLEAIEHVASPPVGQVVERLVVALGGP